MKPLIIAVMILTTGCAVTYDVRLYTAEGIKNIQIEERRNAIFRICTHDNINTLGHYSDNIPRRVIHHGMYVRDFDIIATHKNK